MKSYTVSELNREVRAQLECDFSTIAVTGELSNLSKPSSGHWYFTLKDSAAQLRCVFFRNAHTQESALCSDGQQVLVFGKLSLYEARGDYQLIVQSLSSAGLGELYRQFEQLKMKLEQQGLFDRARKKPLPRFPETIAVITSETGAALHDILTTLRLRYPIAKILLYPSPVQGKEAAGYLIEALLQANLDNKAQVIVLARGGGSMEDLWPFNSEALAFAISQSHIPIVTGVGHETDFTIADFVADFRAATPTAAAQAVTPCQEELKSYLTSQRQRLFMLVSKMLKEQQLHLSQTLHQLASPKYLIGKHWQTLDYQERQLTRALAHALEEKRLKFHLIFTRLKAQNPIPKVRQARLRLDTLQQALYQQTKRRITFLQHQLQQQLNSLSALSPLATLSRGYAIASNPKGILYESSQVALGETISVKLGLGTLLCTVIQKEEPYA